MTGAHGRRVGTAVRLVAAEPAVGVLLEHSRAVRRAAAAARGQGASLSDGVVVGRHAAEGLGAPPALVGVAVVSETASPRGPYAADVDLALVALGAAVARHAARVVAPPFARDRGAEGRTADRLAVVVVLLAAARVIPAYDGHAGAARVRQGLGVVEILAAALVRLAALARLSLDALGQGLLLRLLQQIRRALQRIGRVDLPPQQRGMRRVVVVV